MPKLLSAALQRSKTLVWKMHGSITARRIVPGSATNHEAKMEVSQP